MDIVFCTNQNRQLNKSLLTRCKDKKRRYIKSSAGKDVLHLVEDLDRVMPKCKATYQISTKSTTCESRKGKSREKMGKEEARSL